MRMLEDRILEILSPTAGLTDRELADRLLGSRGPGPAVRRAIRQAVTRLRRERRILRQPRQDGSIANYLVPEASLLHSASTAGVESEPRWRSVDVDANAQKYLDGHAPGTRYASFDCCVNYFQSHREQKRLDALLHGEALELSCLQLGFYLASWGMLRGSSDLLRRSARHLIPVIEVIAHAPADVWGMDAHLYGDGRCQAIFDTASEIRAALTDEAPGVFAARRSSSDTLVTKILLGVFGCVPAFDQYFKRGFGVSRFSPGALRRVGEFYAENAEAIERRRVHTLEFESARDSRRKYSRAKVIDMVFFAAAQPGLL